MRAGAMRHRVELQRMTSTKTASHRVVETWTTYARGWAEMRQAGVNEILADFGERQANSAVFMIRWLPGVSVSDRLVHDGKAWNVTGLVEIGRRQGLQIVVTAA